MRDATHPTREAWLLAAIDAMRPDFADAGLSLVAGIRVSCGFPSRSAVAARSRRIGECWRPEAAADGIPQILVSPLLADPVECPECGYTVRTTARWIAEGLPTCPCGAGMECV